jgi:hypothetical protein
VSRRRESGGPRAKRAPVVAPPSPTPRAESPPPQQQEQAGEVHPRPGSKLAALQALVGFHDAVHRQFGAKRR